jgi:hypothetical protein
MQGLPEIRASLRLIELWPEKADYFIAAAKSCRRTECEVGEKGQALRLPNYAVPGKSGRCGGRPRYGQRS